ncbi:MAG TPA: GtrA family protein [Acidimicrobiales bacterium]|nr:GtrA family protein [Acidimicrobiales bacterium]
MSGLVARLVSLWRLRKTAEGKKMFRYTMVSVSSTVVSFATLGLVYGVFRLWTEVPSTLFANAVATVPAYNLNRRWAWGKTGRSHIRREVLPFWGLSIAGMLLSVLTSSEARRLGVQYFEHDHLIRTAIVEGMNLFAFGVLWVVKFVVFQRLFRVAPASGGTSEQETAEAAEALVEAQPPS